MEQERQFYIPPNGPPTTRPSPEIYLQMGESNIFRMVEDFYSELEKSEIRHLFLENMKAASERSAAFFVFLLGGPPLYQQKYGAPMMRKRHLAFIIDEKARQIWLRCFYTILEKAEERYQFPHKHKQGFILFLDQFSQWMVNHETT